jgi:hypothetical protein
MSLPTPHAPKNNVCCVCGKSGGKFALAFEVLSIKSDVDMISHTAAFFSSPHGVLVHLSCLARAKIALEIISKNNLRKAFD